MYQRLGWPPPDLRGGSSVGGLRMAPGLLRNRAVQRQAPSAAPSRTGGCLAAWDSVAQSTWDAPFRAQVAAWRLAVELEGRVRRKRDAGMPPPISDGNFHSAKREESRGCRPPRALAAWILPGAQNTR